MAGVVWVLLFVWQLVGTVVYLILVRRLFARLAERHGDVWTGLGRPELFANNTPSNNGLFLRWLWRKSFLSLGVPEDIELAARVRGLLLLLLSTFAVLLALFFVAAFGPRTS
jgi:hypothetical protein